MRRSLLRRASEFVPPPPPPTTSSSSSLTQQQNKGELRTDEGDFGEKYVQKFESTSDLKPLVATVFQRRAVTSEKERQIIQRGRDSMRQSRVDRRQMLQNVYSQARHVTRSQDLTTHPLLVDLDVHKDALVFGANRKQFYENVKKMKDVVIEYYKWDYSDKFYRNASFFLKVLCLWLGYELFTTFRTQHLLVSSLDNFAIISAETIDAMHARTLEDIEKCRSEIARQPPDFAELRASEERVRATEAERDQRKKRRYHPLDTTNILRQQDERRDQMKSTLLGDTNKFYALSPTSIRNVKMARRFLLPLSDDYTLIVRDEMREYFWEKKRRMKFPTPPEERQAAV